MILTRPYFADEREEPVKEQVILIDASASMYTLSTTGERMTRFQRAINMIQDSLTEAFEDDGLVSLMIVNDNPKYLIQRVDSTNENTLRDALDDLVSSEKGVQCTYGEPNVEAAIDLCEEMLVNNPYAKVMFYTDTNYTLNEDIQDVVNIIDVKGEGEKNAAILEGRVSRTELNTFRFEADIAVYGSVMDIQIALTVNNAVTTAYPNGTTIECFFNYPIPYLGVVETVMLPQDMYTKNDDDSYTLTGEIYENGVAVEQGRYLEIFSYDSAEVSLRNVSGGDLGDSLSFDNSFSYYGGKRADLNIEYCTTLSNPFTRSLLRAAQTTLASKWNYTYKVYENSDSFETEGYDVYVFEHTMPRVLPSDGLVILLDPSGAAPAGSGLRLMEYKTPGMFAAVANHDILNNVNATSIIVNRYMGVTADENYKVLMTCNNVPVVLLNEKERIFIASIDVHNTQSIINSLPFLMCNLLNYFYPETVSGYLFDVNDTVEINGLSDAVTVTSPLGDKTYNEFPLLLSLDLPGQYTVVQNTFTNRQVYTNFYVKMPAAESDIVAVGDFDLYYEPPKLEQYMDEILMYLAIALVALIVAEWWLQSRSQY